MRNNQNSLMPRIQLAIQNQNCEPHLSLNKCNKNWCIFDHTTPQKWQLYLWIYNYFDVDQILIMKYVCKNEIWSLNYLFLSRYNSIFIAIAYPQRITISATFTFQGYGLKHFKRNFKFSKEFRVLLSFPKKSEFLFTLTSNFC